MESGYHIKDIFPHIIDCSRELFTHSTDGSIDKWILYTNEAMYYILPVILTIGIIFSLINTIVTAKMTIDSHECYLTAFNLSCCLMLIAACVFQLPNYIRQPSNEYTLILPYLPAIENWCWYSCTWLLLTIVIERAVHGLKGKWHSSFGRVHGALAAFLVMILCFVVTLPQYWEFKLSEVYESHGDHNCTRGVLLPRDGVLVKPGGPYIEEYTWYHWFELIFSVGLPYIILPMVILPLVCIKIHIYTSMPTTNGKYNSLKYNSGSSLKDQLRHEKRFNKLIFTISVLYLVMSGPRNVFRLMHNPPISKSISDNDLLLSTLQVLFDVLFYLFFASLFFVYLTFGKKFRTSLYQLCCCKRNLDYY